MRSETLNTRIQLARTPFRAVFIKRKRAVRLRPKRKARDIRRRRAAASSFLRCKLSKREGRCPAAPKKSQDIRKSAQPATSTFCSRY